MTTTGWLLGQRELPPTEIGYLWPAVQAPVTWATGPTYVQALPALVVAQVLVLGPIALLCVYGIASRIGGRLLGYWASFLWVVAPFAAIPLFVDRYHERWIEQFLPQALGLTAMADFPSMVLVLAAVLFVVRSLSPGRVTDAVLAGILIGAAAALKPPNLLVAGGAVLAYIVARRWREGLACGAAIVPALLVLLLWKVRGLGEIPAFALEQTRLVAGSGPLALDLRFNRYLDLNVEHWRLQMGQLREFFWSARLAQWAPVAGLIALLRLRRGAIAALLGGWLAAFLVVKGFSERATSSRARSGACSCPLGPRICCCSHRSRCSCRHWREDSVTGWSRRRARPSLLAGSPSPPSRPYCPWHRDRGVDPTRKDPAEERRAGLREREHPQPDRQRRAARRAA